MTARHLIIAIIIFALASSVDAQKGVPDSLLCLTDHTAKMTAMYHWAESAKDTNYQDALNAARYGEKLAESLGDDARMGDFLCLQGEILGSQVPRDSAIVLYKTAKRQYQKAKDSLNIAACNMKILGIYKVEGDYLKAVEVGLEALGIYESLKDTAGIVNAYINLGRLQKLTGNTKRAIKYLYHARDVATLTNDTINIIRSDNTLGNIFRNMGNIDSAMYRHNHALKLAKYINDLFYIQQLNANIGYSYLEIGDVDRAIAKFKIVLDLDRQHGQSVKSSLYHLSLAEAFFMNTKQSKGAKRNEMLQLAEKHLKIATPTLKNWQHVKYLNSYYKLQSEIQHFKKNYQEAYEYLVRHKRLSDSVLDLEKMRIIQQMEVQNEIDRRQLKIQNLQHEKVLDRVTINRQHIIIISFIFGVLTLAVILFLIYRTLHFKNKANRLLQNQNIEIKSQREALKYTANQLNKAMQTKDRFLSVISHDISGSFNVILGYSQLLLDEFDEFDLHKLKEVIEKINETSQSTYNLFINLLSWAQSQSDNIKPEFERVDLSSVVEENIKLMKITAEKKSNIIQSQVPEHLSVYADKNMVHTILRNLISNAIKFTEFGDITISAKKQDEKVLISVQDTGVGMTPNVSQKLFKIENVISEWGTAGEKGVGFGLLLCKEFVERNNGSISVKSEPGKGSVFEFTLPAGK